MTSIRKFLFLITTLALTAFALPATAQKVYTLNLVSTPSPLTSGVAGQSVTATMNNISPDTGNSTIKSFKLFAANGITITAPASGALVALGNGYTATIQNNGNSIYVSNLQPPLKPSGTPLVLSMTVDVSCSSTDGIWTIQGPWNGSGFTGQTFAQRPPSNLTTNTTGACTYSTTFLNQPKKTFAGYPITTTAFNNPQGNPIQVQLTLNGGAPPSTLVTLTSACTLAGNSASTNASGVATFSALSSAVGTGCTLTASFVTSSATSQAFDIVASAGTLSCDPNASNNSAGALDPTSAIPPTSTGNPANDWGLVRGLNLDGTCGAAVPWTFTLNPTEHSATFIEDSLGQQTSVEYVILWPPVNIDSDGWAGKQPCVSWGVTDPVWASDTTYGCSKTASDYVPALFCLSNNVDGGAAVMPDIPNVEPYAGNSHGQYMPGNKAKMCVAQQGVTSANGQVQYWNRIIDQADGAIRQP